MTKERLLVPLADFPPIQLPLVPEKPAPESPMEMLLKPAGPLVCAVSRSTLPESVLGKIAWRSNLQTDVSVSSAKLYKRRSSRRGSEYHGGSGRSRRSERRCRHNAIFGNQKCEQCAVSKVSNALSGFPLQWHRSNVIK